jgi:hypothetical protein
MPVPSISRDELRTIFSLPDEAIDALMASGRVLCHVRGNEIRFPLAQLESFFRDGLMRVYQTMAGGETITPAVAPVAEPAPPAVAPANESRDVAAPPLADEEMDTDYAPTPLRAVEVIEPPPPAVPHLEPEPEADRPELRIAQRWVPRRQIDGTFRSARFSILQMSTTGLRIRHVESLMPGDEGKLSFALLNPARSFVMRARVVWTSVARSEESDVTFCISGLRITEHADRLGSAIALLRSAHELAPEERRKSVRPPDAEGAAAAAGIDGVSDDEVALVVRAAQHFASDPVDASRWYGRARFALSDDHVRRDAPPRARDREEVLGIWEYLERQVEIPKITGVLTWMRKTRQAQA